MTVDVGHRIARNIANHMPGLAGSPAAQLLAEKVGDAVYTGIFHDHVTAGRPMGTNVQGAINSDITVTNTGTFSGTVSGGVSGVISGSMTAEQAQAITGTNRFSITWNSAFNEANNRVTIIYFISVKDETRMGMFELPLTRQHLQPTPDNPTPENNGGGNYEAEVNYWFDLTWDIWGYSTQGVPAGTVTIGPITVYEGPWNT